MIGLLLAKESLKMIVSIIRIVNNTTERQRQLPSGVPRHHTPNPEIVHLVQPILNLNLFQMFNLAIMLKRQAINPHD